MRLWALGCLHLEGGGENKMVRYGEHWRAHRQRMAEALDAALAPQDLLLVPGDFSLASRLCGAAEDMAWLAARPGTKVLCEGNHDFWWGSAAARAAALPASVVSLDGTAAAFGPVAVAGVRGWFSERVQAQSLVPPRTTAWRESTRGAHDAQRDNEAIFERQLGRLRRALQALPESGLRVAMMHFPAIGAELAATPVSELLEAFGVELCVFAHLHGDGATRASSFCGERGGVAYHLVSADLCAFAPQLLLEIP